MAREAADLLVTFFVACGMVLGGSMTAGLAGTLVGRLPLTTMAEMARRLKFWGTLAALGGTISMLEAIERGLFSGEVRAVARQLLHILAAFAGAHAGYLLIATLAAD